MYDPRDAFQDHNVCPSMYLPQNPATTEQSQLPHSQVVMDIPMGTTTLAQPAPSTSLASPLVSSQNEHINSELSNYCWVPHQMTETGHEVKQPTRHLVNAVEGDIIICWWKGCYEVVEATVHAINAHARKHGKVDKTCQWSSPGTGEICYFSREMNGRHIGSHLHREGQPSPWVVKCTCGYRYVAAGSGNGHQPGCPFKKTSTIRRQSKGRQRTVTRRNWYKFNDFVT